MDFIRLQTYYSPNLVLLTNCRCVVILFSGSLGVCFRGAFQPIHVLGVIFCVAAQVASLRYRAFRAIGSCRVAYYAIGYDFFGW